MLSLDDVYVPGETENTENTNTITNNASDQFGIPMTQTFVQMPNASSVSGLPIATNYYYNYPEQQVQPTRARASSLDFITGRSASRDVDSAIPLNYERIRHSIDILQEWKNLKQGILLKHREKTHDLPHRSEWDMEHPSLVGTTEQVQQAVSTEAVPATAKPPRPGLAEDVVKKAQKTAVHIDEHQFTMEELLQRDPYSTFGIQYNFDNPMQSAGMTSAKARELVQKYGYNELQPPKATPWYIKLLKQYTDLFSLILLASAILCLLSLTFGASALENIFLGVILILVVLINGFINFLQERSSEKVLKGFAKLADSSVMVTVLRDGTRLKVPAKNLVIGDLVVVKIGDKCPADLRILFSSEMKVDNSSLTGEVEPQPRTAELTHKNPLETQNLAFFGSSILEGEGLGMVIRTGNETVIGEIAKLANSTTKKVTPLRREINAFIRVIAAISITAAVIFFVIGVIIMPQVWVQLFVYAIGIVVAIVPQSLIPIITLLLTIACKRLANKKVLIKNLESVETLGSTTCICSDKTGTLTQNKMTVVEVWFDDSIKRVVVNENTANPSKDIPSLDQFASNAPNESNENSSSTLENFYRCIALCSRTVFEPDQANLALPVSERKCIGDASETALLKYYATRNNVPNVEELRAYYPKVFEIPFNSRNKFQLSIHKKHPNDDGSRILFIKGAPERIIAKCNSIMINGAPVAIDSNYKESFNLAYEALASRGERVLGFAYTKLDPQQYPADFDSRYNNENIPKDGFIFLGITGLQDPPKVGVLEAIQKCKTAGIQVVMVTGDHLLTAKAIAKQTGIITSETEDEILKHADASAAAAAEAVVLDGERIETLSKADWDHLLQKKQIVFARTSPQQKLLIVSKFQEKGHIVAVTGDGVNDSPALKKADLGISMGISGSEVSKDAAQMILMDDNFATIVVGIAEGRIIYDNLKKSICYVLSHILMEIAPFFAFLILGLPLGIAPILILVIDLLIELPLAVSLSVEAPEADIMLRKPRSRSETLVTSRVIIYSYFIQGVIALMGCLFAYFVAFAHYGFRPRELFFLARTYFSDRSPVYVNSAGTPLNAAEQIIILNSVQTLFFATVVILQIANLISCKTRRVSILQQGFANKWPFAAIFLALAVVVIVTYVPGLNRVIFGTYPILPVFFLCWIPWFFFILIFNEMRKLVLRTVPILSFLAW